jgi:hypothetical protein
MTLEDAIATPRHHEIDCGCETFWDGASRSESVTRCGHDAETMLPHEDVARKDVGRLGSGSSTRRRGSTAGASVTATHSAVPPIASSLPERPLSRQDVAPFTTEQSGSSPLS